MKGLQNFNALQSQEMEWVVGGGNSREKTEPKKFDGREFRRRKEYWSFLAQDHIDFDSKIAE